MKIILSRKGFDSSAGGHASPILSDDTMVSLPIPSPLDELAYSDIALDRARTVRGRRDHSTNGMTSYADLIRELDAGARIGGGAHLDPDLVANARPRRTGWRPSFGQIGAAGGHLRNANVGVGDLFLFFGWFRHTEIVPQAATSNACERGACTFISQSVIGRTRFVRGGAGFHALFGYLEVGAVVDATSRAPLPNWLADHPHADPQRRAAANNTIYIASDALSADHSLPGAGVFRFDETLVLTKPGEARSRWRLDRAVFGDVEISHHDATAWRDGVFQSCKRGQEFVIDATPRVLDWAVRKIRVGRRT
jgi:hypothetical protein